MKRTWNTPELRRLADALLTVPDRKAMIAFLRDLMTLEELRDTSSRWEVVRLLKQGLPYRDIAEKTSLSTTTVSRIAHWLREGEGGYDDVYRLAKKK